MQIQTTLDGKIAEEAKIREFEHRVFTRRAGLTEDKTKSCTCLIGYCFEHLGAEDFDFEEESNPIEKNYIGTMEIMAPRIYFSVSIEDFYAHKNY